MSHVTHQGIDHIRRLVRDRVEVEGLRPLSSRIGVPVGRIRSLISEREVLSSTLEQIVAAFGLEMYFHPPGEAVTLDVDPPWVAAVRRELSELRGELEGLRGDITPGRAIGSKVVEFPGGQGKAVAIRELQAAAGSGALALDETVKGYVYFRVEWLRKQRIKSEQCSVIGVTGESMEPTLPSGCSILLDHGRTRLRDGAIFVVRTVDGVVVKRAERVARGRWILSSDHDAWEAVPMPDDAVVIGEVKWMGAEL